VVGPDLLLKGATGIRVIDASVMVSKQITSMSLNPPDEFCVAVRAQWTHTGPNICHCRKRERSFERKVEVDSIKEQFISCRINTKLSSSHVNMC
jgi:hypothetical protein